MSKRFISSEQNGIRKKAKLDITVSDHHFPPSQNAATIADTDENNTWGDEIDDEMLLLASQACEKAISGHNTSELSNYSVCMNPPSTSTQFQPKASSSREGFQFKVPSSNLVFNKSNDQCERVSSPLRGMSKDCKGGNENISDNLIFNNSYNSELPNYSICMNPPSTSTQKQLELSESQVLKNQFKIPSTKPILGSVFTYLNDKCEKISSPLRGMSKVCNTNTVNVSDDLIFNNMICKEQDSSQVYRQLLQIKEENEKLKSENGRLHEKCVTKEGEASILRTQLKTCQMAVDNARMDKITTQEKLQLDWSEKLSLANKQLNELRTQLDFKNLEIISVKEKCKLLESNKVKFTQVRGGNESICQSYNNSKIGISDTQSRRVKKMSSAVQTEDKSYFLKLNIGYNKEHTKLTEMLPFIMDQSCKQFSILEYNEKLKQTDSSNKCRIYTTFHRLPSSPGLKKSKTTFSFSSLYEDLSYISTANDCDLKKCLHIIRTAKNILQDVRYDLENIQQRITTAFTKEMDEIYMDMTNNMTVVCPQDMLSGKTLYKEEQGIQARRITTVLVYILQDSKYKDINGTLLDDKKTVEDTFIDLINNICVLLDLTSTATLYSGLLLSITYLLKIFITSNIKTMGVIKNIILSRPMGFVICEILPLMGIYQKQQIEDICKTGTGNLKLDHEQGVLLYRKDSCVIRVILEQIEASLKCIEKQNLVTHAVECARSILKLYSNLNIYGDEQHDKYRCECKSVLMRIMVYTLKICAKMWTDKNNSIDDHSESLQAICQYGVQVLYLIVITDIDWLSKYEGPLIQMCHMIRNYCEEMYSNMISEIISEFQSASKESSQSYNKQAWINSFQTFTIAE